MRRTVSLNKKHDKILLDQAKKLNLSYTVIVEKALEAFDEKESLRTNAKRK